MMEYLIFSGVSCFMTACLAKYTTSVRADELGYVSINERKQMTIKGFVTGMLSYFIPVVNNITGLGLFIYSTMMVFASDEFIDRIFSKVPSLRKAGVAKEIFEKRAQINNFKEMEDAMKLDGADKVTIKNEMQEARVASGVVSDKVMNKVRAMSDAEAWLMEIELNTNLTEQEKKELYLDYVRDFSKAKSKPKAIEKTLKMVQKK